MFHNVDR